jgi:hypothetical protein
MVLSSPEIGLGEGGYAKIFIFVNEEECFQAGVIIRGQGEGLGI